MKTKKILHSIIVALLVVACMPITVFASEIDKDVENDEFTVTVEAGLDGVVVEEKSMPFTVTVGNAGGDFSGILRVIIPADYDHNSLAYERTVAIPSGGKKSISFLLPGVKKSSVRVELENERGKIVLSREEKLQVLSVGQNAVIGILSNDYTGLNYFDGVSISVPNGITTAKIIQLTANNIPETGEGLSTCHYILIDNYNTSQLSEKQRNAIASWVSNGGMLILGTGSKASVVLEGFQDTLCPITVNGLSKQSMTIAYSVNGEEKQVDVAELNSPGWQDLQSYIASGGPAWQCGYGNGTVLVLSYDLAMEPITSWNEKALLASNILENAGNDGTYNVLMYGGDGKYDYDSWYMCRAVGEVDRNKVPNPLLYAGVFLVYVLCIGPIAYLILKAKDKREKMWLVMPGVAVGFTIVVYATSMIYQIHKPFIDAISVVEYNNGPISTRTYMTVQSPKGKEYTIDFAEGYRGMQTWYDDVDYNDVGTTNYTCAVREEGTSVQLDVMQTMAFNGQNLVTQKEDFRQGSGFATNLTCNLSGFEGTITNNTGYDLRNVVVCYNDQYIYVGAMKKGETSTLDINKIDSLSHVYYDLDQWMETLPSDNPFMNTEENRMLKDNQNIYNFMETRANRLTMNQGMIFGMIENYDEDLVKGDDAKVYSAAVAVSYFNQVVEEYQNYSLFVDDINEYLVGGNNIPYSSNYPEGFSYFYDLEDLDMYGESEKEVLYDFSTLDLTGAQLINLDDMGSAILDDEDDPWESSYSYMQYCDVQLYNYTTQTYEDAFHDGIVDNLTPYINEQGWMQVRYYTLDPDTWNYYAPRFFLVGGENKW